MNTFFTPIIKRLSARWNLEKTGGPHWNRVFSAWSLVYVLILQLGSRDSVLIVPQYVISGFSSNTWTLQVTALAQQNKEIQQCYDELEQYGRRLCLRIDSVPKQNNEKAEDVFKFVKGLIEEVPDLEIPEVVIDRAHRIGPDYTDKKTQKVCKSIIVRFTTFRHRTAFYRAWKSIGKIAQVRLDLTKRWYDILKAGIEYIKSIGHTAKFCYADINCRMKIKWGDNSEEFLNLFMILQI